MRWRGMILCVSFALIYGLGSATAHAQSIGPDYPLNPSLSSPQVEPAAAAWGSHVVVVWGSSYSTGYSVSGDGGNTWLATAPLPVNNIVEDHGRGQPSVCADTSGRCFASTLFEYQDVDGHLTFAIAFYVGAFTPTGITWNGPKNPRSLSRDGLVDSNDPWETPQILCDPARNVQYLIYVHRLGSAQGDTAYQVEITKTSDGGLTW